MEQLLKINEQLMGAPAGVLLVFFAIALGYVLKTLPFVNNRYIPFVVVCFCTAAFMLIAPARDATTPLRIWLARNFIIGFIIGCVAWALHAQILRRFLDPKLFNDDGSTKFLTKSDTSNPN